MCWPTRAPSPAPRTQRGICRGFGAIPVAQLRELAESATVTPLPIPPPVAEPGYRPSAAMTEFVRGTSRLRGTDLALARV